MTPKVAFLFLGETLLIPHLYPIVEALVRRAPDLAIDLWVSTSVHERLLGGWIADLGAGAMRIRRAPGFRAVADDAAGRNPALPAKLPMLARLVPHLAFTTVVVCAEQTSLWLPTLLPLATRFVKTSHGVGSMSARDDRRRRAAWRMLVPSERERATYIERGIAPARVVATGYVKASFTRQTVTRALFPQDRPTILYTPHWQRQRSSWWQWGSQIVERLARQDRFNAIIAPHQRLIEQAPGLQRVLDAVAGLPHIHCDLDSFATVDGSYTSAADIYLGDTSSQLLEFLTRPRPCVLLNADGVEWRGDPSYAMWAAGDVVTALDNVMPALDDAPSRHALYRGDQQSLAESSLGDLSDRAPDRAAAAILDALDSPRRATPLAS